MPSLDCVLHSTNYCLEQHEGRANHSYQPTRVVPYELFYQRELDKDESVIISARLSVMSSWRKMHLI